MEQYDVIYYNITDDLDYENSLLNRWGVRDIRLTEVKDRTGAKSFADYAENADGAVVEYELVTREVMDRLKKCRIIALQSIGYNNIDVPAATEHGICVTNAPGFCTYDVALHCIAMILDLARNITGFDRRVRAGIWDYETAPHLHRLAGKTVGLVFFGSIPKTMVPMLKCLGMRIVVYAPTKTADYLASFGAEKAGTLEELLRGSDFVSLHMPLNDKTYHMIGAEQLTMMKKGAFLINTARGAVVDEHALVGALKRGAIAGAAVDVLEDVKTNRSELTGLENVVITPHTAFLSDESYYAAREIALRQIVDRLSRHRAPETLVNRELADRLDRQIDGKVE